MQNFPATRDGIAISASTTSGSTPTPLGQGAETAMDALLDNRGNYDWYVKFGDSAVTVTKATGIRVPAGAQATYRKNNATHVAVVADGNSAGVVHLGEGS